MQTVRRAEIKAEAKGFLMKFYVYNLQLFLIPILTMILMSVSTDTNRWGVALVGFLISVVNFITTNSMQYVTLDNLRAGQPTGAPISQQMEMTKKKYFFGVLMISLLSYIYLLLWTLLLVIPGIIKSFSYSQALNLYKDSVDAGQPLGYNEAITKSRELMNGHKIDMLVLYLSFFFWGLFVIVTLGLAIFFVYPYYTITVQNFYLYLLREKNFEPTARIVDGQILGDDTNEFE
ncbi:DUF975 family protein [Weissella minor]|uniref:DUF975 family protein n=1 Tax=Weissella minor TaxID=1620 RepID=UPI001BB0BBFC|nr:DUF975 family protein [Weissella minor]MBS0950391.1 DUF975 family protein [Weissella minor]